MKQAPDQPLPAIDNPIIQWNPPERLAPVGCCLIIIRNGAPLYAWRTSYIEHRDRQMEYELEDGTQITGRFPWTTP